MRRPAGVTVAAILLGILALFGIVAEGAGLVASIFVHNPAMPQVPGVRATMIGATALELGFFVFCAWTVVGLVRLRSWARVGVLIISGLLCFFCAVGGIGILLARYYVAPLQSGPNSAVAQAVLVGIALFCFLLSLIGVWWLVYFNRESVRRAFAAAPILTQGAGPAGTIGMAAVPAEPRMPGWRIVIMVWSWLILVSVLYLPMALWMRTPMFFFGTILRGWSGTVVLLVFWAVEIYMAVGLLRRWKPAWYVALFFQIYAVGYSATFLLPGVRGRFLAYIQELMERSYQGMAAPTVFLSARLIGFGFSLGLVLIAVLTWALIQRRDDYLGA